MDQSQSGKSVGNTKVTGFVFKDDLVLKYLDIHLMAAETLKEKA